MAGSDAPQAAAVAFDDAAQPRVATPAAPSLRVNAAWTLAGNAVNAGCQWALLVLIARLANEEAVGRFALASAVATPLFLFTGLHLRAGLATDAGGLFRFSDYLGVKIGGAIAALGATAAVVALAAYDRATSVVVLALALTKAPEAVAEIYQGFLQQKERMRPIALSLAARGLLSVLVVGSVLASGGGLAPALLALAAGSLAVLLAYDLRVAAPVVRMAGEQPSPRVHLPAARRIVATSFPLGVVVLAVSLRTYIPRFFIESHFGAAELGIFAALSSFVAAGTLVIAALGQSATPRLARHFHRGEVAPFRRLLARLVLLACGVGAAGISVAAIAGEPILLVVFGSGYAARADLLVWLMGAGLLAYVASFVGYALTAARRFMVQLPLFTGTTLACAALSWWLVPAFGLPGAAAAWGVSLLAELIASWIVLEMALRSRAAGGAP